MTTGPLHTDRLASLAPVAWGVVLFAVLIGLSACEDSVSPIVESDQRFSLYATLDMNRDTQYVRVVRIRDVVREEEVLDGVEVRSVDLTHGTTVQWRDSLVTFLGGALGHVFHAPLRLQPTHRYRIEVYDEGERVTWAETTIPQIPRAVVEEEFVRFNTLIGLTGRQNVYWLDLDRPPFTVQHWYRFLDFGRFAFVDVPLGDNLRTVELTENEEYPGGYEVRMNLVADQIVLDTLVDLGGSALAGLGMTITVLDGQFEPPGGTFDRTRLAQPGTMSNVIGGFGFVGSVGRFSVEWVLSDSSTRLMDYLPMTVVGRPAHDLPILTLQGEAVEPAIPALRLP